MLDFSAWTDWTATTKPYVARYPPLAEAPAPEQPAAQRQEQDPELPLHRLAPEPGQHPYRLAQAIRHALEPFPQALRALIDHLALLAPPAPLVSPIRS